MDENLKIDLQILIENKNLASDRILEKYRQRLGQGKLTRDEDPLTHFGVYFAAFNPKLKEVFIGLHKKAGLWLFSGGHIDRGERLHQALKREMGEEWGFVHPAANNLEPSLLTITEITNDRQICRRHYDIWYFIPMAKNKTSFDKSKLVEEFHQTKWVTYAEAGKLVTDSNTLFAVDAIFSN